MKKKITTLFACTLLFFGASNAQRTNDAEQTRTRNVVVTSTESSNRGGCVESPYDASDPIYQQTIEFDAYCCDTEWDELCENEYQYFLNGCVAESPYDSTDVSYITVVLNDDYCCGTEWDEQCELYYAHVVFGCNALSPYGPNDALWEQVILQDSYCCENAWDEKCEAQYQALLNPVGIVSFDYVQFTLYPNPANNMVKLQLNNSSEAASKVQVYDNSGVLVLELIPVQGDLTLNTTSLCAGTYHVVLATSSIVLNQKLVLIK